MFLNNRSRRLKAFKNEKNENKKTLKSYRFELNDARRFVNKKTLMIKWETAILELFNLWTEDLLNRSFINCFESDLSSENDIEKNASWMRMKFWNWNKKINVEIEANNNKMMKKINAVVETNEEIIKKIKCFTFEDVADIFHVV